MREYLSADIRNIAIVGHGASGKTMLCESMLACSGVINRLGRISQGNTASDFFDEEQKHQHSIYTSLLSVPWHEKKINVLDAPGYADFVGETLAALRAADLAVVVVHGEHGVQLGTETAWGYADSYGLAKVIVLNALDRENANFDTMLAQLQTNFGSRILPLTVPVHTGPTFYQVLDVLNNKLIAYKGDELGTHEIVVATGAHAEQAKKIRYQLAECVAESDDTLLEKFFELGDLPDELLLPALSVALRKQAFVPLFATSGEKNIGVTSLLDFVATYGISPLDNVGVSAVTDKKESIIVPTSDSHPSLFVFKTVSESKSGALSLFKLVSGEVKSGISLYNSARNVTERVGQLFAMQGRNRTQLEHLYAGDIAAVAKLKDTHTNNTLCDPNMVLTIPAIAYPGVNMKSAIKCRAKGDEEKLSIGLSTLREEDPTFSFKVDPELHQMVISGQGELHLEICVEKLRHRFGLDVETFQPRIAYRETIKTKSDAKYRHKKQSGGAGQFAEVWMRIEPKSHDEEVEFTQSLVGQNVDRVYVPSVEKGVKAACQKGALAGYKVVGIKVDFYDGKQHPVDSKDIAFQIAGKHAFKEAFLAAKPCLLEPILLIAVKVPNEFTGDIMSDLSSRRGKILGVESEGRFTVIKAHVPQADMYRYATILRSLVGGRGVHTENFDHYEQMSHELELKVVVNSKIEAEEEVEN